MKVPFVVLGIPVMLASCIVVMADPHVGTWKLNLAKSTFNPGPPPKSQTVTIEADGANLTVVIEGVDGEGKPINPEKNKVTVVFDGKDHPTPNPAYDTSAWKRINGVSYEVTRKKAGTVVQTGISAVAPTDGKTRTVTTKGTNARGETINNVAVYDKQIKP